MRSNRASGLAIHTCTPAYHEVALVVNDADTDSGAADVDANEAFPAGRFGRRLACRGGVADGALQNIETVLEVLQAVARGPAAVLSTRARASSSGAVGEATQAGNLTVFCWYRPVIAPAVAAAAPNFRKLLAEDNISKIWGQRQVSRYRWAAVPDLLLYAEYRVIWSCWFLQSSAKNQGPCLGLPPPGRKRGG